MIASMTDEFSDRDYDRRGGRPNGFSLDQAIVLLAAEDNDRTLPEACCECSGGIDISTFEDALNQSVAVGCRGTRGHNSLTESDCGSYVKPHHAFHFKRYHCKDRQGGDYD
jgi:hypothetical protein